MDEPGLRLQSLASMAHALGRPAPLLPLLETAAEEARTTLHAASVSISRTELDRGLVRTVINVGELGPDEVRWPTDEVYVIDEVSRLGQAVREGRTWSESLADPACDPFERDLLVRLGKGSSMATPILVDGVVWGEFYLTRNVGVGAFDTEAESYSQVLSAMLGAAVARTLREAELEDIARRDPLTGLANRRAFDECAARLFDLGAASTRPVTILSIDINGLKEVNDERGHVQGDALIRSIGRALDVAFGDLRDACIARVGGDEFTVVVADHPVDDLIDRINIVCGLAWTTGPHAGVSAGLASADLTAASDVTPTTLFAAADRAQYTAKRSGSKDVVVARASGDADAHDAPGR